MKKNKLTSLTSALIFGAYVFTVGCSFTQSEKGTPLIEAKAAITASNDLYFRSFAKHDPRIFTDRYAEDCLILAPNAKPFKGHAGAQTFFKLAYEQIGLRNGKFITQAVYGNGDSYVTEIGLWKSFDKNNHLLDDGKFLVLWKKTTKGWKMFRDSFSSNHPTAN